MEMFRGTLGRCSCEAGLLTRLGEMDPKCALIGKGDSWSSSTEDVSCFVEGPACEAFDALELLRVLTWRFGDARLNVSVVEEDGALIEVCLM